MTPKEFFDKVVEMHRCQKEYFKNKRQIDLRISKQIEREVDEEIERVQKILHDKQNPQLFQTMVNMKILDLPLKAKWYEMIESGNKKEEYREIKKYWIGRLAKCGGRNSYEKTGFYCKKAICFSCITRGNGFHPKEYTHVRFRFGYTKRTMLFELESITIGVGNTNWGAPDNECVFILKLGKCIKKNESKDSTEFQPKNS